MNDKYLSVITNFGCHYSCQYCILAYTPFKEYLIVILTGLFITYIV